MLDKERIFFSQHHDELRSKYQDKFVVIKDETVAGAFPTHEEALEFGAREFGLQSFLVRNVNQPDDLEITVPALALGLLSADTSHPVRS
jgi:hypothetical protein